MSKFPKILRASLEHLSALPAWFQKRPFWANFDPDVGDPSCQYNPLIFTEHIPGEDEYRICINMRLHILSRENILCITFRLDGTLRKFIA